MTAYFVIALRYYLVVPSLYPYFNLKMLFLYASSAQRQLVMLRLGVLIGRFTRFLHLLHCLRLPFVVSTSKELEPSFQS